jgi:DNA polymerase-3 subunit chi
MMTQVEFLLLESKSQCISTAIDSLARLYTDYERVLVIAPDQQLLVQLNELLWHNSSDQFIPYSIDSECYSSSSAVLLTTGQPERLHYSALLNVGGELVQNPQQFRSIIEMVMVDDESTEQARERYKIYRQLGFDICHKKLTENS